MMTSNCLDREPTTAEIVQGENKSLNVRLYNADDTPLDLTGASEIVAAFPSTGTPNYIEKKLSLSQVVLQNAPGGWIIPLLNPADTNLLPVGVISFEVRVTNQGLITAIQFLEKLEVKASLFPTAP